MLISEYLKIVKKLRGRLEKAESYLGLNAHTPGYAVSIFHRENLVFKRHLGVSDVQKQTPINQHTLFLLSSLTKPLVGNVFLKNIDKFPVDKLHHYTPGGHPEITLGHLIKHQSGLQDYMSILSRQEVRSLTLDELVQKILSWRLNFKPGINTSYSNSGYVVLSKVLQQGYGQPYDQVLDQIYGELNCDIGFSYKKGYAKSYELSEKQFKQVRLNRYVTGWGDGYSYASVYDYHQIFSNQLKMQQLLHVSKGEYGLYYTHSGSTLGGDTAYCYLPSLDLHFTIFSNFRNKDFLLSDLLLDILDGVEKDYFKVIPNEFKLPQGQVSVPASIKE